jgi:predicted transcriptional regulator
MKGLFDRLQSEIDARERQEGLSPIDLLDMPPEMAAITKKIVRRNGMKLEDIAAELGHAPDETQAALDDLVKKGFMRRVEVNDEVWYKAFFGRKADKKLSTGVWSALDNILDKGE